MTNEKRLDLIDRQALGIGRCDPDAFPLQNRSYVAGWNGVINLLEQAPRVDAVEVVQQWIPVSERLPDKDGDYLVVKKIFNNNIIQDVLSFAKDGRKVDKYDFHRGWKNVWHYYDSEWGHITVDSVTHWMPLPEPPKVTDNG